MITRRNVKRIGDKNYFDTEISPGKNGARLSWLKDVSKNQDILTVSQGALNEINSFATFSCNWRGKLHLCDINDGVHQGLKYIYEDIKSGKIYQKLKNRVMPPGKDLIKMVIDYSLHKSKYAAKTVVLDVDFTQTIRNVWTYLYKLLLTCKAIKQKARVLLTIRNRGLIKGDTLKSQINWLKNKLKMIPGGASYSKKHQYSSGRIKNDASRTKGSAMCVIELFV